MPRQLLLVLIAVVLVAVTLVASADQKAAAPKVVSAERFDLVDASGKVRLRIGMAGTDPAIGLRDEKGTVRAMIAISGSTSAAVELKDAAGRTRLIVGVAEDGGRVTYWDEFGKQVKSVKQ